MPSLISISFSLITSKIFYKDEKINPSPVLIFNKYNSFLSLIESNAFLPYKRSWSSSISHEALKRKIQIVKDIKNKLSIRTLKLLKMEAIKNN